MPKSDSQLQKDVMEELVWDPSVGRAEIGVAVAGGVVTLSGQVDSYPKKSAAIKVAERVGGVRAVADDLIVKLRTSSKRTDMDIAHAVADSLRWHIQVPDDKIKARVDDGWVWLDGEVEWEYQRVAADHAVRYLTGVKGVSNNVSLKKLAWAPEVRGRIESALKRSAELDASQISVEAMDGEVTLRGHVHSSSARSDAERAAWSAPGVTSVKDDLTVQV
jgi:osmotically-inducible protein OsmY